MWEIKERGDRDYRSMRDKTAEEAYECGKQRVIDFEEQVSVENE